MENAVKGKPAVFKFTKGEKTFTLYGIVPKKWNLKSEKELIVLSKDSWEINMTLLLTLDKKDAALPTHSKIWFMNLLNDFIPNDYNYAEIILSMFTIKGLNEAYTYSALTIDDDGKEFLREDLIIIDQKTPLRIKGFGENTDEHKSLIENFILSLRYQPYESKDIVE